jgi:hypothetical protein
VCSLSTTEEQVISFIYRWRGVYKNRYLSQGLVLDGNLSSESIFVVVGISYLTYEIQSNIIKLIKTIIAENCPAFPLIILSHENDQSQITLQFAHKKVYVTQISSELISSIGSNFQSSVMVWKSQCAGAGKTFNIKLSAFRMKLRYRHVPINNSFTLNEAIINRLRFVSQTNPLEASEIYDGTLYHIDLSSSVDAKFADILFGLCFLGILQDFNGDTQSLFFCRQNTRFAIELASGTQDNDLDFRCQVYPTTKMLVKSRTICTELDSLQAGMGEDFASALYDGIFKNPEHLRQKLDVTNSYSRLKYVICALDSLKRNQGLFPFVFDDSYVDMYWQRYPSCRRDAFSLIVDACSLSTRTISLHCIWSFINVFFWQLQEMHHPESPLNGCCLVDETRHDVSMEQEIAIKGKMKGEIISLIARTGREFATRQLKETPEEMFGKVCSVRLSGFSRGSFNTIWRRQPFDNDGQPCFQSMCRGYYLYFRSQGSCWVIDDIIYPSGSTYSISESKSINSRWTSSVSSWTNAGALVQAKKGKQSASSAYNDDVVIISGCAKLPAGSYASVTEDGVYFR